MYGYISLLALGVLFTTIRVNDIVLDRLHFPYSSNEDLHQYDTDPDMIISASGYCGSSSSSCAIPVLESHDVRVALIGWAVSDINLGAYACPRTTCILSKHTPQNIEYDILVSSLPPRFRFPLKMSPQTRHVEISLESSVNTLDFISVGYFMESILYYLLSIPHTNNVDLLVRYQPPEGKRSVQFLPTSYVNEDMDAFVAKDTEDRHWLDYEFRDPSMSAVISNCVQRGNNRLDTLNDILRVFSRVHKFGGCFQDDESQRVVVPPALQQCLSIHRRGAMWDKPKECILKNVMFSYSIENSFEYGYLTEKLWQPLKMGAIPVISMKGVPENKKFLPHADAALIVEDFPSTEELAVYMLEVSKNKTLWFKHAMAWRYLPMAEISNDFKSVVNNSMATLPCRICEWWLADTTKDVLPDSGSATDVYT